MANTKTQMAEGIASLVRGQRFAGSGVWRQSGNATLRIQNQTQAIVNALSRLPSKETQEEEERESDRQHEELVGAIESSSLSSSASSSASSSTRGFGKLLGKNSALFKVFSAISKGSKGIAGLIGGGLLKGIGLLFRAIRFVGLIPLGLAGLFFFSKTPEEQKEIVESVLGFFSGIGEFLSDFGKSFKEGFFSQGKLDTRELSENFRTLSDKIENLFEDIEFTAFGSKRKGIVGIANTMGEITFHFAQGFLDLANAIVKFAIDPGVYIGILKGSIMSSFDLMGRNIKQFFDAMFSMKSFVRALEFSGMPTSFIRGLGLYESAAESERERGGQRIIRARKMINDNKIAIEGAQEMLKTEKDMFKRRDLQAIITRSQNNIDYFKNEEALGKKQMDATADSLFGGNISGGFGQFNVDALLQGETVEGSLTRRAVASTFIPGFDTAMSIRDATRGTLANREARQQAGVNFLRFLQDTGQSVGGELNQFASSALDFIMGNSDKGNVNFDQSVNPVTSNQFYLGSPQTRLNNPTGGSSSKNRGGKD